MNVPDLREKKVLVVGLARSGVAAANFLHSLGASVSITDAKPASSLEPQIRLLEGKPRLILGEHTEQDFLAADLIVLSPGVPSNLGLLNQAREQGVPVWSEVELAYRFLTGPVLGVTGSNGKTTTTALIGAMFQAAGVPAQVAGNIGNALSGSLHNNAPTDQVWIVELSSFQLENIHDFHCRVAVLLNLTPDHQDRYPNFEAYQQAKARIFMNQTEQDFTVANADDPLVAGLVDGSRAQKVWFSRRERPANGAALDETSICWYWEGQRQELLPVSELALRGVHNFENALAAVCVACLSGLPMPPIREALRTFSGVEHRLEWVRNLAGVDYYNDSKATNVESARVAVQAFSGPLVVILGGLDKGQDFSPLKPLLQSKARAVVIIGQSSRRLFQLLESAVRAEAASTLPEAVQKAKGLARAGDTVLLAPACASFDMFTNFEERGQVFKSAVRALASSEEEATNAP